MIAVRIPKEIKAYKEKLILGLTLRHILAVSIAGTICIPLYIFGRSVINEELLSWLVLLIAVFLGLVGFFKYNGMPMEKFTCAWFKLNFMYPAKRVFRTENYFRQLHEQGMAEFKKGKGLSQKKRYQASLERAFIMKGSRELDPDSVELFTVTKGGSFGGKPPKRLKEKKPRKEKSPKKAKLESKKENFEILENKVKKIKAKQQENPQYVLNVTEIYTMKIWNKAELRTTIKAIKAETRKAHKINRSMSKRRKMRSTIPKTTQQTIPYIADYEEGMFEVEQGKYSKVYQINDINYLIAKEDEQINIFCRYGEFLNYFSEDTNISIVIDNRVISASEQEEKIFCVKRGDTFDCHREEYNEILKRQIAKGKNDILQTKYITVTISCESAYEALLRFNKIDAEVIDNIKKIGSRAVVLSTEERLAILHDKFRKGREGEFSIDFDFIKTQGISSKDYIAPTSFYFSKNYFMIEDEYYRCMYVNNLPASLTDEFISDIVDCNFPLITTIDIQPVAQDKAVGIVKRQLTGMESNKIEAEKKAIRSGYDPGTISHELKQSLGQAETLLDDLMNKNQKMFFVSIVLMANGKTMDELNENCKLLSSKARKYTCQLQSLDWQQEDAFKTSLPVGLPPKKLSVERTLTTESVSIFIPFASQEMFQLGGFYYGLNQMSRNIILINRRSLINPSGFILGSSGSGKSFATKREILNVILNDDESNVLIVDPENEYGNFAKALGGTVIDIAPDSMNHINPFDMSLNYGLEDGDDEDIDIGIKKVKALVKKSDYIMSIVQCMLSDDESRSVITPQQKTLIDRCVSNCYGEYMANNFDERYLPTLATLQHHLDMERTQSEDGRLVAEAVEYYTKGSMNVFSHKTNIDYQNRFVVFNIRDLGKQLKQVGLLIVLDFIWNRMASNSSKKISTFSYADEIHVLFQNPYSAKYLEQLYKRGRKYGLVITGVTQNMQDLLRSNEAKGMISNSEFVMMLKQSSEDLKILMDMLGISEAQATYVSNAEAGSGLISAGGSMIPFADKFPGDSNLYKLMSTKFGEASSL